MPYDDAIRIGATLLTILLPTVTAYFAFRSAERKITVDRDRGLIPPISYEAPFDKLANATSEMCSAQKKHFEREYDWQQAVLRELHVISTALRN